ncbi:MAG: crotonase/enoyl-CoA hydratase family protein [Betaproteobacteria bacterium]
MDMNVPQELLVPAPTGPGPTAAAPATEYFFSEQLSALYDQEQHAIWLRWNPRPRPNFNPELLADLDRYCQFMTHSGGSVECQGARMPLEYAVLASKVPGVFNLGGDLNLFARMIESQDCEGLRDYGRACVNVLFRNYQGHGLPITTISLVQGQCLGGGFEAALSSDIIIAERQARFGFPEILFNMFPGMGAYSFLERKIGKRAAEELVSSGRLYSADDMLTLGVIDLVVEQGRGESEVGNYIKSRSRNRNALAGIAAARRCVHKLDYEELLDVVDIWVDTALGLGSRDLKLMQRLVSRQNELRPATGQDENVMGRQLH